jgi:hypothetical protein
MDAASSGDANVQKQPFPNTAFGVSFPDMGVLEVGMDWRGGLRRCGLVEGVIVGLVLLGSVVSAGAAEPLDTARSIISRQIEAFLADDATAAYSFASPGIKRLYPDQAVFFEMVKRGYQPVYRPGNFAFGRSKVDNGTVLQEVLISGPDGKDWTALYTLTPQPDGTYKINGVQMLQQAPGPEI